ncbi:hypothetical protein RMSM_06562 [Rhodopirellula maiorica SM1]|uniref:Uncharacterized protein n=1 Tax=Rhodopirellula maiorica SM1 TaxID=1265738 RepID=M5RAI5_9BACT|nr:hypothetical protein RMSM_06562 [Rhodopirellula maiorica SM1]
MGGTSSNTQVSAVKRAGNMDPSTSVERTLFQLRFYEENRI